MEYIIIIITAVLVNNFILTRFLGICPFLGVSKKTETATGMGIAVTFVMSIASVLTYALHYLVLIPFQLEYLKTIAFILVIASLVQIVEMVVKRFSPALYNALGVYLPLITTNCAVLGVALINIAPDQGYNLLHAFLNGFGSGVGFTLAILILSGIREKLTKADIPQSFKGFPITLIAAAIMAMAFAAFTSIRF
ncbi:MAG: electron transport complex subunit RsxA [Firmicutes bacterium]|nr:electron transport complex subunit RsxA [Bacillota bacterium]